MGGLFLVVPVLFGSAAALRGNLKVCQGKTCAEAGLSHLVFDMATDMAAALRDVPPPVRTGCVGHCAARTVSCVAASERVYDVAAPATLAAVLEIEFDGEVDDALVDAYALAMDVDGLVRSGRARAARDALVRALGDDGAFDCSPRLFAAMAAKNYDLAARAGAGADDAAVAFVRRAIRIAPDDVAPRWRLAAWHDARGDTGLALEVLRDLAEAIPAARNAAYDEAMRIKARHRERRHAPPQVAR